jgi:hypothetical protein
MTLGELFYRRACLIQEGYTNNIEFDTMFENDTDLGHAWCRELWRKRNADFYKEHEKQIEANNERLQKLKPLLVEAFKHSGKRWNDPVSNPEVIPNFRLYTAKEIRERWEAKRREVNGE